MVDFCPPKVDQSDGTPDTDLRTHRLDIQIELRCVVVAEPTRVASATIQALTRASARENFLRENLARYRRG